MKPTKEQVELVVRKMLEPNMITMPLTIGEVIDRIEIGDVAYSIDSYDKGTIMTVTEKGDLVCRYSDEEDFKYGIFLCKRHEGVAKRWILFNKEVAQFADELFKQEVDSSEENQ